MKPTPRTDITNGNQLYWQMRSFWTDALSLKEPLPSTLSFYLKKYAKEDDAEFVERVKRIAQVNFVDLIVDSYCSMLFSTDIRIESAKYQDKVAAFVNRCNLQGDTLKDYFRELIAPAAFTFGLVDVFCDMPEVTGLVETVAQQQAAGANLPYCYMVPPLNRTAWSLSDARDYTMYRSQDVINTQISSTATNNDEKQYSEWTLDSVTVYDHQGNPVKEARKNPFGFIPAVTVTPLPTMRFYDDRMGLSLVQDVVPLQKLVLNLLSLIYDFHESVNFATRVLKQDTTDGDEPPTEGEMAEGGNKRGIIIRGKDSDYWTEIPDSAGVVAMCGFLQEIIDRAYQSVRIPSDANTNKTHQSRGTIRGNLAPLYNRMVRISRHFEKAMRQVIETALRVQGINVSDAGVTVTWGNNFAFEAFINAVEEATAFKALAQDMAPTAVASIVKKAFGSQIYDTATIKSAETEIDQWVKRTKEAILNPVQSIGPDGKPVAPTLQKQNTEINAAEKIAESEDE